MTRQGDPITGETQFVYFVPDGHDERRVEGSLRIPGSVPQQEWDSYMTRILKGVKGFQSSYGADITYPDGTKVNIQPC